MTLPVKDPSRPVCRFHFQKRCKLGDRCRFYHPPRVTRTIEKKARRKIGSCYCGAGMKTIMNRSPIRDDEDKPLFFRVCARTGRSIRRCM